MFNYTATLLDDIILYKKADGSDSYFNSRDKRDYAMVSCEVDGAVKELGHIIRSKTLLDLYNDTITYINRTEQAIEAQDIFEIFTNDLGASLNSLKAY